jgi:predicted transcriptional regulator
MGRLTKAKIDEITKLREQNYTQKEIAEKVGVNLRTVRKYDPLREQKLDTNNLKLQEVEEAVNQAIDHGLVRKQSDGRASITSMGIEVMGKLEHLQDTAVLELLYTSGPLKEEKILAHLHNTTDELFDEALNE